MPTKGTLFAYNMAWASETYDGTIWFVSSDPSCIIWQKQMAMEKKNTNRDYFGWRLLFVRHFLIFLIHYEKCQKTGTALLEVEERQKNDDWTMTKFRPDSIIVSLWSRWPPPRGRRDAGAYGGVIMPALWPFTIESNVIDLPRGRMRISTQYVLDIASISTSERKQLRKSVRPWSYTRNGQFSRSTDERRCRKRNNRSEKFLMIRCENPGGSTLPKTASEDGND